MYPKYETIFYFLGWELGGKSEKFEIILFTLLNDS